VLFFLKKHIVILVENLPVSFDRRVWQEACALTEAGYKVSVVCPRTDRHPQFRESLEGVEIYRHPLPEAEGKIGYFIEYPCALFFQFIITFWVWLRGGIDAIHACNPPDLLWLVALPFKIFGVKFVFDHHDICPELFSTKFAKGGFLHKLMFWLEKQSFNLADKSIATNKSYQEVAINRGNMAPEDVYIVRSAPDLKKFDRLREELKDEIEEKGYIQVGYVGVMGNQEGIDLLLETAKIIKEKGEDIKFVLIGSGPAAGKLPKLSRKMDLADTVEFTGRISDRDLVHRLMESDICVNPDLATPMNDKSTMNKIMEYMSVKKPIVQFNITEGRYSAKNASLYAAENNPQDMADKIINLANNPARREQMGEHGRNRLEKNLSWQKQKKTLKKLYSDLFTPN
jgi:glycosyltransferase involved in cell wall biosynthesis